MNKALHTKYATEKMGIPEPEIKQESSLPVVKEEPTDEDNNDGPPLPSLY